MVVLDALSFVVSAQPRLWGLQQHNNFLEITFYLTLYHDLFHHGYRCILQALNFEFPHSDSSLLHNASQVRLLLRKWGENQIILGDLDNWRRASRHVPRPTQLEDVCLWVDSSDFKVEKQKGSSTKRYNWSFKENHPAQRYMFLFDGRGVVRRMWG